MSQDPFSFASIFNPTFRSTNPPSEVSVQAEASVFPRPTPVAAEDPPATVLDLDIPNLTAEQKHSLTPALKEELAEYFKEKSRKRRQETVELRETLSMARQMRVQFHTVGRTTIAFCEDQPGLIEGKTTRAGRVIFVATSVCHPNDAFVKWRGEAYAAKNLLNGQAALFKVPSTYMDNLEFVECLGDLLDPVEIPSPFLVKLGTLLKV